MFLGDDLELLPLLVLALGAAMCIGSVLALVRPPVVRRPGDLERAPIGRSILFATVGLLASVWAVASLVTAPSS
jgi:hypothetical protein